MPQLNDILYVKKFAWLPKNIFPQYSGQIKPKDFIWIRKYYRVYKYMTVSWAPKNNFVEKWVWVGNTKNI